MTIVVRAIERSEFEAMSKVLSQTFGGDLFTSESRERFLELLDVERTYAAFDGKEMVGTSGAFSKVLSIPGGTIPMAGLTLVCVRPSHTRRGVLRAMMASHEEDMRTRGEALSGLWASETSIYPRFGYGLATESYELETDARHLHFAGEEGGDEIRFLEMDEGTERLAPIYAEYAALRVGCNARSEAWWKWRVLYDGVERRSGASSLRLAVARRGNQDVGYILYRQSVAMTRGIMAGAAKIVELVGLDFQAEASLWKFAARLDLFPNLSWWNAPVDAALPWLVTDRRQVHRSRFDALWLRLRDVPAALGARRYEADGALTLLVGTDDSMTQTSAWELVVHEGVGECRSYAKEPELRLSRQSLSSLYLGGFRASELACAGKLHGSAEAIARADRILSTGRAPWCAERF